MANTVDYPFMSRLYLRYPQKVSGTKQRFRGTKFREHYNQAQLFYNSLKAHEQAHLASAISFELSHCDDPVVPQTYVEVLNNIDFQLAKTVARNVGADVPEAPARPNHGRKSEPLSQTYYEPKSPTIASRRIAILLADGFNLKEVLAVRAAIASAGGVNYLIGPCRGEVYPEGDGGGLAETGLRVDHHWEGQRSTLFDALFVPSGLKHAKTLSNNGRTVHWVREAFGHCKAIGATGEGGFSSFSISDRGSLTHHLPCCNRGRVRRTSTRPGRHAIWFGARQR